MQILLALLSRVVPLKHMRKAEKIYLSGIHVKLVENVKLLKPNGQAEMENSFKWFVEGRHRKRC